MCLVAYQREPLERIVLKNIKLDSVQNMSEAQVQIQSASPAEHLLANVSF